MKQGWEIKKLGDCFDYIKNGANIKQERGAGGVPITRIETLSGGTFNRDRLGYANIQDVDKFRSHILNSGDILMSHINSKAYIGRTVVYIKDGDETIIHGMNLLRLKVCQEIISPFYMHYYSLSDDFKEQIANRRKDAVNQSSISVGDLKTISVPVPPLPEQECIVAELDCLSDIIEKQKQQLNELDNLAQSIFYTTFGDPISNNFGWKTVPFDQLCHSMTKGPFGSDIKKSLYVEKSESTYKVYIQANAIDKDLSKGDYYISQEYFDEKMFRFEVHPYDYIITCDGTLGKFIRLPQVIEKGIISASLLRLSLNEEYLIPKYFEFIWDAYMLPLLIKDVRNTALKHLPSASKIGEVCIPLPSVSKQQEFASKIEAIEKQKDMIKQSIAETETLFNSRMDYYFN